MCFFAYIMNRMLTFAYHNLDDVKNPRVSALANTIFEGLPPCLFIVADLDVLPVGNLGMRKKKLLNIVEIQILSFRIS